MGTVRQFELGKVTVVVPNVRLQYPFGSISETPNVKLSWDPAIAAFTAVWLGDCDVCGGPFETTNRSTRVCGQSCRQTLRRRQTRDRVRRFRGRVR